MLGYDMFSLAPSFLQQFLTLLSLATISPYTLFREPLHLFSRRRRFLVTASKTKKKKEVIVISGPIDFGKSRLTLELAKRLNGEIVSADSIQRYS
ncbi:hypothetical protein JHK82_055047 [Glycine max]|nr:hypothetical protein JHK82_055047 [Glycine max]